MNHCFCRICINVWTCFNKTLQNYPESFPNQSQAVVVCGEICALGGFWILPWLDSTAWLKRICLHSATFHPMTSAGAQSQLVRDIKARGRINLMTFQLQRETVTTVSSYVTTRSSAYMNFYDCISRFILAEAKK